jgi:drug/metabolite transporter (DMT)-like permease
VKKTGISDIRKFVMLIICIGTMQFTTNFTFEHMPVGYSLSLFQLSAIVSVFFGYRFFKERDIRKKLLGSIIMIAGSVMIIFL